MSRRTTTAFATMAATVRSRTSGIAGFFVLRTALPVA
jgi:hypothetical protein